MVLASGGSEVEAADHLVATKLLPKSRGRETQQEDLDALEESVSKAFKGPGYMAPAQSQSRKGRTRHELCLQGSHPPGGA